MWIQSEGWTRAEHLLQVQIHLSVQMAHIVRVVIWITDFKDHLFLVHHLLFLNILIHQLINVVIVKATRQLLNLEHRESFIDALVLAVRGGSREAV